MKRVSILTIVSLIAFAFIASAVWASEMSMSTNQASKLIGRWVQDWNGTPIGTIYDIVVGNNESYLILAEKDLTGKTDFGQGEFVAIPWKVAQLHRGKEGNLVIDLNREKVFRAPAFSLNDWPEFTKSYTDMIHGYFAEPFGTPEHTPRVPSSQYGPGQSRIDH